MDITVLQIKEAIRTLNDQKTPKDRQIHIVQDGRSVIIELDKRGKEVSRKFI